MHSRLVITPVTSSFWAGAVIFFVIAAGYFMGRNCTWPKALERGLLLFIPFLAWNFVISLFNPAIAEYSLVQYLARLVGYKYLFFEGFDPLCIQAVYGEPFSTPTWFLRDLILCTFLAPLLVRWKWLGLPLIVCCLSADASSLYNIRVVLSPCVLASYCIGLYLAPFDIGKISALYKPRYSLLLLVAAGWLAWVFFSAYVLNYKAHPEWGNYAAMERVGLFDLPWFTYGYNPFSCFASAFFVASYGLVLVYHAPRLGGLLARCAPVSFLLFVLHYPIILFLSPLFNKVNVLGDMLIVAGIILGITAFYFLLKRLCPAWLPYIANVRLPQAGPRPTLRKLLALLAALCVICPVGGHAAQYVQRHLCAMEPAPYSGKQAARREKHEAQRQHAVHFPQAELVMLGDSIIEFWRYAGGGSWDSHLYPLRPLNMGIASDTTGNMLWRLRSGLLDGVKPKVVVLCAGANNIGRQKCLPCSAVAGVASLVEELRNRFPAEETAIIILPPPIAREHSRMASFREALLQADWGENITVCPVDSWIPPSMQADCSDDGLHPNAAGYAAMAPGLARMVGEKLGK